MQNVSVWFIRKNLKVLAFLLWYEFPVIRLRAHQAFEQDDEDHACNVTLGVQLDHGVPLELVDNVH